MLRDPKGNAKGGKLGCPYHGWVYDGSGKVVEIPSEGPDSTCAKRTLCLKPLLTLEQDGCVWVWMGESEPSRAPFDFPSRSLQSWVSYFMITDFENEVTHLAENFMDVPHTVFVHRGWFRTQSRTRVPIRVETAGGSVLTTYDQPRDSIGFTSRILNPLKAPMTHTDRFILPNVTRVDYAFGGKTGFVITSQITPVSTLRSRVYTEICYRLAGPKPVSVAMKPFFRFYTRRVIEQDVVIMGIQGANLREDMRCRFNGTDADVVHTAIERLRELAVSGDPCAYTETSEEKKVIWI